MPRRLTKPGLLSVYRRLHHGWGPQHWWPASSNFEVMVGAILTQNTAWTNVEKAVANLRRAGALSPRAIVGADPVTLQRWLRPSGTYRVKAARLRAFCSWLLEQGGEDALAGRETVRLRRELLRVRGVGPETADAILLYALGRSVFVIDAYTRRLFSRLGMVAGDESYETLRRGFETALGPDTTLYNEFHALVVQHAKAVCRLRPECGACVLARTCPSCGSLRHV